MERIMVESPSLSQKKERKITLAEELRKFGIDIDNDIAMNSDVAALESLLNDAEKWREEKRSKTRRRDGSKFATNFESWSYDFLFLSMLYLALNPFTAWFWAPFVYFLS
jgi:hypothetical protein